MRKFLTVLCCLMFVALSLSGQQRTGNIFGTVLDKDGTALPGVNLILTGATIAPITAQSNAEGKFRFLSLFPASDYKIKAELQGFKTRNETGIIVNIGLNSEIKVVMEQGALEEQVTVIARTPMVQAKKTQITHTVSYDMLQSLPSARDPWVILQMTPSIFIDRENVGGSESGQQSSPMVKGTTVQEWTLDGVQITDLSSGGSPGYYDFDAFEEMNVSTGQLDVEHRSPGININLVTRRGGNKTSLAGRFYLTDQQFQGKITNGTLAALGLTAYNKVVDVKDMGFNAGGALWKDKIWWWGSFAIQNEWISTTTTPFDKTLLTNIDAKLNFQIIPENRAEIFIQSGKKEKFARSSSLSFPSGWDQLGKFHFGSPTIKIQDEHMFGDSLFASVRYGFTDAGFGMYPSKDLNITYIAWYDYAKSLWNDENTWFFSGRPHTFAVAQVQFFNDNLFGTGTGHEMKLGFEINNNRAEVLGGSGNGSFGGNTAQYTPGNFYVFSNYNVPTIDWDGNGTQDIVLTAFGIDIKRVFICRNPIERNTGTDRMGAYFSDIITFGRFNLTAQIRWDRAKNYSDPQTARSLYTSDSALPHMENYYEMTQKAMTPDTIAKISALMPDKSMTAQVPQKIWDVFSPRFGLSYDVFGDGSTIAKVAWALFPGNGLGYGYWSPSGLGGTMNFWWNDANNDKVIDWSELYWANYTNTKRPVYKAFDANGNFVGDYAREKGLMWNGWDWGVDAVTPSYYRLDLANIKISHTNDLTVSLERQITRDLSVSLSYNYRDYSNFNMTRAYYPSDIYPNLSDLNHIRNKNDYAIGGYVPGTVTKPDGTVLSTKDAAGRPWYYLIAKDYTGTTSYTYVTAAPSNSHNNYWGWDLVVNKRLSNKWMFNGSFTYQMERVFWGDDYTDPTNKWAYDGSQYGISLGGNSGKTGVNFFSVWLAKAMAMYMFPLDINVSFTLSGHQGAYVSETVSFRDMTLNPQSYSNTLPTVSYDHRTRLSDVWTLNLKVEKMVKIGDTSRMWFGVDLFNALNQIPVLRQYDNSYGTFVADGTYIVPGSTNNKVIELMTPWCIRFGMRFQL